MQLKISWESKLSLGFQKRLEQHPASARATIRQAATTQLNTALPVSFGSPFTLSTGYRAQHLRRVTSKAKRNLADDLLDVIEGGPKLRKWYGAAPLDEDGDGYDDYDNQVFEDDEIEEDTRDCILVTDAESEMGQMLVLQLIIARQRVRVLVKDAEGAKIGFGPYVEVSEGDTSNVQGLAEAMKGAVKTIICPGKVGEIPEVAPQRGIQHVVMLSSAGINEEAGSGFLGFGGPTAEEQLWRSKKREARLARGKTPYTIVRLGRVQNSPGGKQQLMFAQDKTLKGNIAREDAASVCIKAAGVKPNRGRVFQVVGGQEGGKVQDIGAILQGLSQEAVAEV